jgi:hypothetical protein
MYYNYSKEREAIFTEEGQREFLIIRDRFQKLLKLVGAVRMQEGAFGSQVTGSTWKTMAYVDRLVELGEIREITQPDVPGQHRVFISIVEP